jgi:hypothetical protein
MLADEMRKNIFRNSIYSGHSSVTVKLMETEGEKHLKL